MQSGQISSGSAYRTLYICSLDRSAVEVHTGPYTYAVWTDQQWKCIQDLIHMQSGQISGGSAYRTLYICSLDRSAVEVHTGPYTYAVWTDQQWKCIQDLIHILYIDLGLAPPNFLKP